MVIKIQDSYMNHTSSCHIIWIRDYSQLKKQAPTGHGFDSSSLKMNTF